MTVRIDRDGEVLLLRFDRPEKRNAINRAMVEALHAALTVPAARAVVVSSTDPACFSAGADLGMDDAERAAVSDQLYALYERILALPIPVIAAINGPAVGGGAALAIACDLRFGGPTTRIRFVGPNHGLAIGAWGLPSLVGRGRAMDLAFSMRDIGAEEALRIGLVDRLVEHAGEEALAFARSIADLESAAVARFKAGLRDTLALTTALAAERRGNAGWHGRVRP